MCRREGVCMAEGACMAVGVHDKGRCVAGEVCVAGGHAWQERRPLQRM